MKKGLKIALIIVLFVVIVVLAFLYVLNIFPFNIGSKTTYNCIDCKGEQFDYFTNPYNEHYNCCKGTYYETR